MINKKCLFSAFCFLIIHVPLLLGQNQVSNVAQIRASAMGKPPAWAIMQKEVILAMEDAADFYWSRFTHQDGSMISEGPYDDLYEMFFNWPDFYIMGGDDRFFERALQVYNGITITNTPHPPDSGDYFHRLYKEFPKHDDFFHISEGMTLFYNLFLGNPNLPANIDRACRFAGFYLNEDPEAKNFDSAHTLIPSIFTGSKGPLKSSDAEYNLRYGHASLYPIITALEPDWHLDPKRKMEVQAIYDEVVTQSDVPVNLAATGLMTHAYLATGDQKYKTWVLKYVDAWMDRIDRNGGIIPDNIGINGKIGERRHGQWWGGLYGWYGRYGVMMMYAAMTVATECAYLLSGDEKYLGLLRTQIDQLLEKAITLENGQQLVPYRRNQEGWHSYRPMMIRDLAHLWHASMKDQDWNRIMAVRTGHKFRPLADEGIWGQNTLDHIDTLKYSPSSTFDWSEEQTMGDRTMGKSEYARLMYYAGENPNWPFEALQADYTEMSRRMEFMRNDPRPITEINKDDTYPNNPIITKALQQTTMGTPQTVYFGGLLRAMVRYFDISKKRPGLPKNIAALVTSISKESVGIDLINLDPVLERSVLIQAGAFGEHRFTSATWKDLDEEVLARTLTDKYVVIIMPPSTQISLELGIDRFVNDPSYRFPWSVL